jgi:hypothetical protein
MSRWIKIANDKGRWARVRMESPARDAGAALMCPDGGRAAPATFIKGTHETGYGALLSRCGDDAALAEALIRGDPEIDFGAVGRKAGATDRIFLSPDGDVLYAVNFQEVIFSSDGLETGRRELADVEATIDPELPPVWSGRLVPRAETARRFAFTRNYRMRHVDGLTFDFLFDLARTLEQADAMAVVGSGPKGTGPLYLERNGIPYFGLLEGRTKSDTYLLILHLSNMELKRAAPAEKEVMDT